MPDRLRISSESRGPQETTITLEGELDLVTAPVLRDQLGAARDRGEHVVIDLEKVTFLDSTGLTLLMQCSRDDEHLRLRRAVGPAVARLLEVTRTEQLFSWADDA